MVMNEDIWHLLGIVPTKDIAVIRQAYRTKLPDYHPERDPEGFKALRQAYDNAILYAQSTETVIDQPQAESEVKPNDPVSDEQIQANEICAAYQALLNDPNRCYKIDEWQKFIGSFYDYPMAVIDIVKWQLLEISYETTNISQSCVNLLAENLRWRQQLITQYPDQYEHYNNFLKYLEGGDFFDYTALPTTNKQIQNVTIDYVYNAKWTYWEQRSADLYAYLQQDTVIYLPDDKTLMLALSYWHCVAELENQAILDYALSAITQPDQAEHLIIEWKYIAANQYTLLNNKQQALQAWIDLYHSGHYVEKAESWIAGWCAYYASNYLPLLFVALNDSYCLEVDKTDNYLFTIPQFTPTTIARLAKIDPSEYNTEIADFINWALSTNWNYRQILLMLLHDDGNNRLFRLYRHAIMLRHGNETLLQQILDEQSDDPFEQFILTNLKRQAKQHLAWLSRLTPVKEFKAWLYDNNENLPIPARFDPDENGDQFLYSRLFLDRFDHLPDIAILHLYKNLNYTHMEMYDWVVYFKFQKIYQLPSSPNDNTIFYNENKYWQWYRECILALAIVNSPFKTAQYLQQHSNTFNLSNNNELKPIIEIFKNPKWQTSDELYCLINNDNKLINSMLISYPDSIESFIDDPNSVDFDDIEQKLAHSWHAKLKNGNRIYLMFLYKIVLNKPSQAKQLDQILKNFAGDDKALIKLATNLNKDRGLPYLNNFKQNASHYQPAQLIQSMIALLSQKYGICSETELEKLEELKDNTDNDLILRLCATLLFAQNNQKQAYLNSLSLPKNEWTQFWRWNGRTDLSGFVKQSFVSLIIIAYGKIFIDIYNQTPNIFYVLLTISYIFAGINIVFAIKRRLNDSYQGQKYFFSIGTFLLIFLLYPCYQPSLKQINRFGPPLE